MSRYVYDFTDGSKDQKDLLGGKGANLAEMTRMGLPVPPGFTITTEVCTYYYEHKRTYPPALRAQMEAGLVAIELAHGAVASYIQPGVDGSPEWVATMEARDDALTLDAASLLSVAAELSVVSALCTFLQSKSEAFVGEDAV